MGDLDLSLLAGEEGLLIPGTSDGETKLIKKDGKVLMYSWTAAKTEWTAIGEGLDFCVRAIETLPSSSFACSDGRERYEKGEE